MRSRYNRDGSNQTARFRSAQKEERMFSRRHRASEPTVPPGGKFCARDRLKERATNVSQRTQRLPHQGRQEQQSKPTVESIHPCCCSLSKQTGNAAEERAEQQVRKAMTLNQQQEPQARELHWMAHRCARAGARGPRYARGSVRATMTPIIPARAQRQHGRTQLEWDSHAAGVRWTTLHGWRIVAMPPRPMAVAAVRWRWTAPHVSEVWPRVGWVPDERRL